MAGPCSAILSARVVFSAAGSADCAWTGAQMARARAKARLEQMPWLECVLFFMFYCFSIFRFFCSLRRPPGSVFEEPVAPRVTSLSARVQRSVYADGGGFAMG